MATLVGLKYRLLANRGSFAQAALSETRDCSALEDTFNQTQIKPPALTVMQTAIVLSQAQKLFGIALKEDCAQTLQIDESTIWSDALKAWSVIRL